MPLDQALIQKISSNDPTLTSIDLDSNHIGAVGAKHLSEALKVNNILKFIDLSQNDIETEGAKYIGEALKINTTLISIALFNNNIGPIGAKYIGKALEVNQNILYIYGVFGLELENLLRRNQELFKSRCVKISAGKFEELNPEELDIVKIQLSYFKEKTIPCDNLGVYIKDVSSKLSQYIDTSIKKDLDNHLINVLSTLVTGYIDSDVRFTSVQGNIQAIQNDAAASSSVSGGVSQNIILEREEQRKVWVDKLTEKLKEEKGVSK